MSKNFNPRSLAGATTSTDAKVVSRLISIHAPLRERLIDMFRTGKYNRISIHAPLRERQEMT